MKAVLDACCGSRMFWLDRQHPDVVFMDCREESHILCDGRALEIKPDVVGDFRKMPFSDGTFRLVVFDPPHLIHAGESSWLSKKYGKLDRETWREDLKAGFRECFRVLEPGGILVLVRGSDFNGKSAETGQPGTFVRAPSREDCLSRFHEILHICHSVHGE